MSINITDELKTDFLVYAQEVNNNRAFADARDGLKISQRAVLWEMFNKGYSSNKPHIKSAKVDGGVIANWHPHGSEYQTIVRMSQPWVNNLPEINFHGANGSQIGGPDAAASRYTECRLDKVAEAGLFYGINKNTVDFILNYSEDEKWPAVFPALLPTLFVNGSQGIGYTIAQEWEPGNLTEFVGKVKEYINTNNITCDDIYPDYPTGGIIVNKSDMKAIYETGKGTVILRGKATIDGKYINITELPYQVYAELLIQKIKDLVNAESITGIEDICNKSDDAGLFIEIECSEDPNIVLKQLYKQTELQSTFSANQMALVNGTPTMLTLADYIKVYIDHNIECIKREYEFDRDKASSRLEVLNGLIRALLSIDSIINTIKKSDSIESSKTALMNEFGFTENQAKAIVDMKLGKLANLEQVELNKEAAEMEKIISKCDKLLKSEKLQKKEFLERLDEFAGKYSWERRTEVVDIDLAAENKVIKEKTVDTYVIALTKSGFLRRISKSNYKSYKAKDEADEVVSEIETGEKDRIIMISEKGTMYKVLAKDILICNYNAALTDSKTLCNNEKVIAIFNGNEPGQYLFMITEKGLAKKLVAEDVFNLSKNVGAPVMKVNDDDRIIACYCIDSEKIKVDYNGKAKTINSDDFITKGRTAGGVVAVKIKGKNTITIVEEK